MTGAKPLPFFNPVSSIGLTVDRGINVGYRYKGSSPDIGAYEYESGTKVASMLPSLPIVYRTKKIGLTLQAQFDIAARRLIDSKGNPSSKSSGEYVRHILGGTWLRESIMK